VRSSQDWLLAESVVAVEVDIGGRFRIGNLAPELLLEPSDIAQSSKVVKGGKRGPTSRLRCFHSVPPVPLVCHIMGDTQLGGGPANRWWWGPPGHWGTSSPPLVDDFAQPQISTLKLQPQTTLFDIEAGDTVHSKFDDRGLIPCITRDNATGDELMLGGTNDEALGLTKLEGGGGASCPVGYRSCFYRELENHGAESDFKVRFIENEKVVGSLKAYRTPPS